MSLIAVVSTLMAGNLMAVEEAEYSVSSQQDKFEIRQYAPSIVAEVTVDGDFENASNAAFRKLFNYIAGDNTGRITPRVSHKRAPIKKPPTIRRR